MNRKYWRAMGLSPEQYRRWRIESIIETYFDYVSNADEWGIDEKTIIEMIAEQKSKGSESSIKQIIDSFKNWQRESFKEIYEYGTHGDEIDSIVKHIMNHPRRYFDSPSGDITNLIGEDSESITNIIKGY